MGAITPLSSILLFCLTVLSAFYQSHAAGNEENQNVTLLINATTSASSRKIPETLFGVYFEEVNHAGAGGLWAELISNRGFEAGASLDEPPSIEPWSIIGKESHLVVSVEPTSPLPRNKLALKIEVLCDEKGSNICPSGGVGVYNPGFWGMGIAQGLTYKLSLRARTSGPHHVTASLIGSSGLTLASLTLASDHMIENWTEFVTYWEANGTDPGARLQLTTTKKSVIWFDQISMMPETFTAHGCSKRLARAINGLEPGFLRFPGSSRTAFSWKDTIVPWEERPGHSVDVWNYWTDDGLGFLELLQLAEDLGTSPIWVFRPGNSFNDQVDPSNNSQSVQELMDALEFAWGEPYTKWGYVRDKIMDHPDHFDLRYIVIAGDDCQEKDLLDAKQKYVGNYLELYNATKQAYPQIKIISNCGNPADYQDYQVYGSAFELFSEHVKIFDNMPRNGPKIFVSEYAVIGPDAGDGTLLAGLAEAGFLIGLERNSDLVEMASYATFFANSNDRTWRPAAYVFNSSASYGTPSYWAQQFFGESNGATLLNATLQSNLSESLTASAIAWSDVRNQTFLRIKVVNIGDKGVNLHISINGLKENSLLSFGSTKKEITSADPMDENSLHERTKVAPVQTQMENVKEDMDVVLSPHSLTLFDLLTSSTSTTLN